jgi:hypothetical protein
MLSIGLTANGVLILQVLEALYQCPEHYDDWYG